MGMDTHCTTDRPSPSSQTPTGELTKFNDIDIYISKPPDYPHSPSKLLLLLTSGTGVKSINNQLQADRFASEGFVVVMPDQFGGDPAPNSTTPATESGSSGAGEGEPLSLIEQVKLRAAETAKSFMIDMWLARQTPEKVLPILHKVLESAKDEFADAVANGGGVYAAGYCFGGKYVMMLAGAPADAESKGRDEEEGMVERGPLIKAGAIAHATLATREDVTAIKAPVSIVCVGKSNNTTPSVLWEIHKANRGDGNTQKTTSYSPKRSSRKEGNISKKTRWTTKSRRIQACHMVS
jgi:dienelactone hydrolase